MSAKDEREEEKEAADLPPPTSLDATSSLDKDPSTMSSDGQPEAQKTEVDAASRADIDAASAGQKLQPELPENQTLKGCLEGAEEEKEGRSRADIKGTEKKKDGLRPFSQQQTIYSVLAYHPQWAGVLDQPECLLSNDL